MTDEFVTSVTCRQIRMRASAAVYPSDGTSQKRSVELLMSMPWAKPM